MPVIQENIQLAVGHSFRPARCHGTLRKVNLLTSPRRSVRISGEGKHGHCHRRLS